MSDQAPWLPQSFLAHMDQQVPEVVYHYTTQIGLLGIIKDIDPEFWATKVQYLNDSTEFKLALELAKERVRHLLSLKTDERQKPLLEAMLNTERIGLVNIFVACFCENGDLLSQWRGYSGTNGFSIAMKSAGLRSVATPHGFRLGRCIYDRETQVRIIDEAIQRCLSLSMDPIGTAASFEMLLLNVGAFFKHEGFLQENEWRLVSRPTLIREQRVSFRPGKSMPSPYYKIPLGNDLRPVIDGVIVGPCPHKSLSASAVTALLIQAGVTKSAQWGPGHEVNVRPSTIPYRDW